MSFILVKNVDIWQFRHDDIDPETKTLKSTTTETNTNKANNCVRWMVVDQINGVFHSVGRFDDDTPIPTDIEFSQVIDLKDTDACILPGLIDSHLVCSHNT